MDTTATTEWADPYVTVIDVRWWPQAPRTITFLYDVEREARKRQIRRCNADGGYGVRAPVVSTAATAAAP